MIDINLIMLLIGIACISYIFYLGTKENWTNTYSGWPGPLETGCSSCYNISALHPRYNKFI